MKKIITIGLLLVLTVLSSCMVVQVRDEPIRPDNMIRQTPPLRPELPVYMYSLAEQIKYPDGKTVIGEVNLKNGNTILIVILPMTLSTTRGAASEDSLVEYDVILAAITYEIERNPLDGVAYLQRASILLDRGRTDDLNRVIDDCNTALRIDDNLQEAYYIRGMAAALKNDFEQAISDLTTIRTIREYQTIGILYMLGKAYYEYGSINQAIEMFENVMKIDPGFLDTAEVLEILRMIV
ncbi:MAG: hypothetical protein FWD13_03065 [Treponema sp.]|nr:hypothetical protein [Treponema sp.]